MAASGFQDYGRQRRAVDPAQVGERLGQPGGGLRGMQGAPPTAYPGEPSGMAMPMGAEGVGAMPSSVSSSSAARPDGAETYDPTLEHSYSASKVALEEAVRRSLGTRDRRPAMRHGPYNRQQLGRLGMPPMEIDLADASGLANAGPTNAGSTDTGGGF